MINFVKLAATWMAIARVAASASAFASAVALAQDAPPFVLKRISEPGPIAGVIAHVRLDDPRVEILLAPAGGVTTPAGASPTIALDTTSQAARTHNLDLALNASFFSAPSTRPFGNKRIAYFVGNAAQPVGWHMSNGLLLAQPRSDKLRATVVVHTDGRMSIADGVMTLPPDARHGVSGNALLLMGGINRISEIQGPRAPRSAVGLSADGKTLLLLALDGRGDASRGMSLHELAELLKREGAHDAVNLDGGGSTTMALKDLATGVHLVANRPSDASTSGLGLTVERAVADVIGVRVKR